MAKQTTLRWRCCDAAIAKHCRVAHGAGTANPHRTKQSTTPNTHTIYKTVKVAIRRPSTLPIGAPSSKNTRQSNRHPRDNRQPIRGYAELGSSKCSGRLKTKSAQNPRHARLFSASHLGQELLLSRQRLLLLLEHLYRRGVETGQKNKRNKQARGSESNIRKKKKKKKSHFRPCTGLR